MCGTLRHLKRDRLVMLPTQHEWAKPNSKFRLITERGEKLVGKWDGHAREENLVEGWLSNGWRRVDVLVDGYSEGTRHTQYEVPTGYVLHGIARQFKDGYIFKLVTRQANGAELAVHDRFPKMSKLRF